MKRMLILALLLIPALAVGQTISSASYNAAGDSLTISGSSFGTKSTAAPVVWDNLEDGTCNTTATVGTWSRVGSLIISTANARHSNSTYCGTHDFDGEAHAAFRGGSDSEKWYTQYWFYLDDNFDFGSNGQHLSNLKIMRYWTTQDSPLNNTHIQLEARYDASVRTEAVNTGRDLSPVVDGYDWVNLIFGHSDPGYVDGGRLGWREYENDIPTGEWHLFQFEFEASTIDVEDGTIRWWYDGTLIFDRDDMETQDSGDNSIPRIHTLGFYNATDGAAYADGDDKFFIDDAYIDNTWARVELGNASTYALSTVREIQPPLAWSATSITVTANNGSFAADAQAWVYVTDDDGNRSTGYSITIGGGGEAGGDDVTAPSNLTVE